MTETITLAHNVGSARRQGAAAFEQTNPADADDLKVIGPEASAALVGEAAEAARAAQARLVAAGIEARADALSQIERSLIAQKPHLALLIARETGKTLSDAAGEVVRAARIFGFFAGETLRIVGERFESTRPGLVVEVMKEPVGVVGLITPWNFPIAIPAWKVAPALAFGNGVVWKPSEVLSATADALLAIINETALPAGAVNMVLGAGETGRAVVADRGIDAVSFTGSAAVGAGVRVAAAERGAPVQLELGGVNGFIVAADADLTIAAEAILNGAFFASGQRCTATSRIIVEDPVADEFIALLSKKAAAPCNRGPARIEDASGSAGCASVQGEGVGPDGNSRTASSHCVWRRRCRSGCVLLCAHAVRRRKGGGSSGQRGGLRASGGRLPGRRLGRGDRQPERLQVRSLGWRSDTMSRQSGRFQAQGESRHAHGQSADGRGGFYHAPFGGVADSSYGPREQGRAASAFYTATTTTYLRP